MYTTVSKLTQTLPAVGSVTTINSAVMAAFIGDADAVIDSKLANVYTLPLSGTYPLLAMISTDIALYRLMTRRVLTEAQGKESSWPSRYKEAMDLLDKLASGDIPLVSGSGEVLEAAEDGGGVIVSTTENYSPTFSELDSLDQSISEVKLDDLSS